MRHTLRHVLLCFLVTPVLPAVTIITNPNPTLTVNAVTSSVTGADLRGLQVTATYAQPSAPIVVPLTWTATGPTSGQAGQATVSVSITGNASAPLAWQYRSQFLSPLLSLTFDGSSAGIFFDRSIPGSNTPGSGPGADVTFGPLMPSGIDSRITATYSQAVALTGSAPQGDLYAQLTLQFPNTLSMANFDPQDFAFTQPVAREVVPEPSTFFLSPAALLFLGKFRQRLRRTVAR
jgi:hypothetical protein